MFSVGLLEDCQYCPKSRLYEGKGWALKKDGCKLQVTRKSGVVGRRTSVTIQWTIGTEIPQTCVRGAKWNEKVECVKYVSLTIQHAQSSSQYKSITPPNNYFEP